MFGDGPLCRYRRLLPAFQHVFCQEVSAFDVINLNHPKIGIARSPSIDQFARFQRPVSFSDQVDKGTLAIELKLTTENTPDNSPAHDLDQDITPVVISAMDHGRECSCAFGTTPQRIHPEPCRQSGFS